MANCYECIHYYACSDVGDDGFCYLKLDRTCKHFKHKADFVEVKKAAEMFAEQFGYCPCNFNNIDEWLPYICEHSNVCECSVQAGWEQFIRHYGERK